MRLDLGGSTSQNTAGVKKGFVPVCLAPISGSIACLRVVIPMETEKNVVCFTLGRLLFEYGPEKNRKKIEKHGISFR